jgi:hypothetical protein
MQLCNHVTGSNILYSATNYNLNQLSYQSNYQDEQVASLAEPAADVIATVYDWNIQ